MTKHPTMYLQKPENERVYIEDDHLNLSCDECGEPYQKPVLATVSANGNVQTHYACPHCLAKINEAKTHKKEENKKVSTKAYRRPDGKLKLVRSASITLDI